MDGLERTRVWRLEPPWPVEVRRLWEDSWTPADFPVGILDFLLWARGRTSSGAKEALIGIPSDCLRDEALEDEKRDIVCFVFRFNIREQVRMYWTLTFSRHFPLHFSFRKFGSERNMRADNKWRKRAIITGWITAGTCFGLFAVTIPFVIPAVRKHCLPYVPATPVQIRTVLSQLKGRSGKVIDLGSGDGRVVGTYHIFNICTSGYRTSRWTSGCSS